MLLAWNMSTFVQIVMKILKLLKTISSLVIIPHSCWILFFYAIKIFSNDELFYIEFMNDFEKLSSDEIDTLNQPYDHESIMHYPQKAFAINKTMDTLVPIQGMDNQIFNIGFRKELSERDIIGTNLLYNCSGKFVSCQILYLRNIFSSRF